MQEEYGESFISFEYHITGALSTAETAARGTWYGVGGVPAVRIDGKVAVDGAESCDQTSGDYRARIEERLQETEGTSPVQIAGSYIPGEDGVAIEATFELLDPVAIPSLHAMLILYENEVPYGGKHWQHVVRAIVDQPITLESPGDRVTVSRVIPVGDGWNAAEIHAVAFLQQTTGNRPVIQAARLPYGDFEFAILRRVASLPSGNGQSVFDATVRNSGPQTDTISIGLDAGSFAGWDATIDGAADRPLNPGEESLVRVRVRTDAVRAVRGGTLRVASRASGRESSKRIELFNGGRSLLVVDDDGNRADESAVLEALAANGMLCDVWDSYHAHGQDSPLIDEIRDYEIVLWHTGFDLGTYPLDRFDIGALDQLMAGGNALCLTSQGFLNGISTQTDFVRDDLGVASWTLDTGYAHLDGTLGDPIGDALSFDLQFNGPFQSKGDDAVPGASAVAVLTAPNGSRAMLRNVAPNGARAVFMPVALNSVPTEGWDPNNMQTLVGRIVRWLEEPMTADAPLPVLASARPLLFARPNPACGETRISFELAESGPTRLELLDVTGRRVDCLFDDVLSSGRHEWSWNATGSGVRFLRLTTPAGRRIVKLIVLDRGGPP
jgi:hypothetical protein